MAENEETCINEESFRQVAAEYEEFEELREKIVKKSRDVIRGSKKLIYSIHRNEEPGKQKEKLSALMEEFRTIASLAKDCKTRNIGAYRVAVQEMVEAASFYNVMTSRKIPAKEDLEVDDYELYLLGLADLVGELTRRAVNEAIREEYGEVVRLKGLVEELYRIFSEYDFRNGELRKKFDGMKYELKKLEDIMLELKMKGKI